MSNKNRVRYLQDKSMSGRTRGRVIVIGGGQAGLAIGHFLSEAGVDFLILESGARIGDAWRKRWDSLRLFSAAQYSGLPGFPFPGDPRAFPTKDEVADYLEEYAHRARLPVRFNTKVETLKRDGERYVITVAGGRFEADQVVVATGPYQKARVPSWATELDRTIVQIHAGAYKNPSQLPAGDVLVVGAGNTGSELALEAAAAGHRVWLSGRRCWAGSPFLACCQWTLVLFPRHPCLHSRESRRAQDPRRRARRPRWTSGSYPVQRDHGGRHTAGRSRLWISKWSAVAGRGKGTERYEHFVVHRVQLGLRLGTPASLRS